MLNNTIIGLCAGSFALIAAPLATAQNAPPPAQTGLELKTIGVPSNTKPEIVPSLIVMNSQSATLQGDKLTLTGVSPNVIIFADRPVRSAGHALTVHFLEEWDPVTGGDSFAKDPPNATVSAFDKEASTVKDAVVELTSPTMNGTDLTFNVKVLEGNLNGADGPASVFIDIIGMPRTPSVVRRRRPSHRLARRLLSPRLLRRGGGRRSRGRSGGRRSLLSSLRLSLCGAGLRRLSLSALLLMGGKNGSLRQCNEARLKGETDA
jgi:hypothetical protein